jgi:predicted Zn-dependent protease
MTVTRSLLILALLLASPLGWCETPVTGRAQQMTVSRADVQSVAANAYHRELKRLASRHELDTNPRLLSRVRKISARLIAQAILLKPAAADWPWEIHVTSNDEIAAYAMAGGKLLVGSKFVTANHFSDNELAVLLAHEIAHVIAEHVREQVSLAASFNPPPPHRKVQVQEVVNDMDSDISVYLRLQPLSRLQELEADDIGIELAARAGTPSRSIDTFYRKIADDDDGGQSLFDTHGSPRQREAFVSNMLGYASIEYKEFGNRQPPVYIFR